MADKILKKVIISSIFLSLSWNCGLVAFAGGVSPDGNPDGTPDRTSMVRKFVTLLQHLTLNLNLNKGGPACIREDDSSPAPAGAGSAMPRPDGVTDCISLRHLQYSSVLGFPIRPIDSFIHKLYSSSDDDGVSPTIRHVSHQRAILEKVRGCEAEVFNDPGVIYPYRDQFSGKTGTMSNILTSGYFSLYNTLLDKGIEVNAASDMKTIFSLIQHIPVIGDEVAIPAEAAEEKIALAAIIKKLKTKLGAEYTLLSTRWFEDYEGYILAQHEKAMGDEGWIFYKGQSIKSVDILLSWSKRDPAGPLFLPQELEMHKPYEYRPPYMKESNIFTSLNVVDRDQLQRHLRAIKNFFNQSSVEE